MFTEGFGDAGDHADVTDAVDVAEAFGGLDVLGVVGAGYRHALEREHRVDPLEDLVRRYDLVETPGAIGIEGHELDEAHRDASLAPEGGEVDHLVVVDAAHHDTVDLDRIEAGLDRGVDPRDHPIEIVTAGELVEDLGAEGVEGDVDPAQPRIGEIVDHLGELDAVGGHGDVDPEGGEHGDQPGQMGPDRGLTAGDAHRLEAPPLDAHPDDAGLLLIREEIVAVEPGHALFGHAVGAPEIAPIGDRDPQIRHATSERVDQRLHEVQRMRHPPQSAPAGLTNDHSMWLDSHCLEPGWEPTEETPTPPGTRATSAITTGRH